MNLYIVPENDLARLSELDGESDELQNQYVSYVSAGFALVVQPAFMGTKIWSLPLFSILVAWVFGPFLLLHGWRTYLRYRKLKIASKTQFTKIKERSQRVPGSFALRPE